MSQPVRIGLLGAGLIGTEHARYTGIAHEIELVALADPAPAARAIADENGVPHFDDYNDLLTVGGIDAVIVALPNSMHADAAVAAIDYGVAVLVEKPIAGTLGDARRILDASETQGIPVLVGHQRRYAPDVAAARKFIAGGGIGRVVSVGILSTWRKDDEYFSAEWRSRKGGGPIFINLIHDIDVMRYLVGDIESVVALGSSAIRNFDVCDTAGVLLRFVGGAIGTATVSDAAASPWCWDLTSGYGAYFPAPPPGDVYFIAGTEASIALPSLTVYRHDGPNNWKSPFVTVTVDRVEVNPYIAQLEHFAAAVRGEAEPVTSARDGFDTLAVAVAIDESLDTGAPVKVETAP